MICFVGILILDIFKDYFIGETETLTLLIGETLFIRDYLLTIKAVGVFLTIDLFKDICWGILDNWTFCTTLDGLINDVLLALLTLAVLYEVFMIAGILGGAWITFIFTSFPFDMTFLYFFIFNSVIQSNFEGMIIL